MSRIKLKLKRIDPVKSGVIYGLLMALISLVVLIPMFMVMSAVGVGVGDNAGLGMFGGGLAMLIFAPIIYGIIGFVFGLIGTALMNFILGKTNGLDVEFDSDNLEVTKTENSNNVVF